MVEHSVPKRSVDPARTALGVVGSVHLGAMAFTDNFESLSAAAVAYAAAWWVVRQGETT